MDHFAYRAGALHAEDCPVAMIADVVGTPFYVYSAATLRRHYHVFAEGFDGTDALIAFAVKALSNLSVLELLGREGAGADIVSAGELDRARRAGIPGDRIVFSGVGKTGAELAAGLDAGILQFNVESEAELHLLSEIAAARGVSAPVALRVNPDIQAGTDDKISTGRADDKFGVPRRQALRLFALCQSLPGVEPVGFAMHIGSQITDLAPFEAAAGHAVQLLTELRGAGVNIRTIDLGGGLGIPYALKGPTPPLPQDYAKVIRSLTDPLGVRVILEPGRMIAGNAGLFVTRIIRTKTQSKRRFAIVDGAMNDLIRPALYGARHEIMPVREAGRGEGGWTVAGPVCETTDVFDRDAAIDPRAGDLLAFRTAGAYGAVQASQYNSRPLVPEVLVDGDRFAVVRRRPSLDDMLALELSPEWRGRV
jgi:diaminopimelate decarboxylase